MGALWAVLGCRPRNGVFSKGRSWKCAGQIIGDESSVLHRVCRLTVVMLDCSYRRSRAALWRKGESSGQVQQLVDFKLDCDGDTVLLSVDQLGVACHTGRRSCFYRAVRDGQLEDVLDVEIDPKQLYKSSS